MLSTTQNIKVVQCNYLVGTSSCSVGARAYLAFTADLDKGRVWIVARSKGGRWISKWESLAKLHHFRIKTMSPSDPLASTFHPIACDFWTQDKVDAINHAVDRIASKPKSEGL